MRPTWVVAITAALMTALLCRQWGPTLAIAWSDDTPVVFAHYINHPDFWTGDDLATYAPIYAFGSALNWGTALLERFLGISPVVVSLAITFLQNILFALGFFAYARRFLQSERTALLATMFTLAAQPWAWNLALYQPAIETPYAGHFVLAFALFAAACVLDGRYLQSAAWLTAGAFVHPALILITTTFLAAAAGRRLFIYVLPLSCAIALPFFLRGSSGATIDASALLAALRANQHMYPIHADAWLYARLPAFLGFLMLGSLTWRKRAVLPPPARRVLLWSATACAAWMALHVAAWLSGIPILIQLNGHRATIVLILLWMPAIVGYLDAKLAEGIGHRVAAALILSFQAVFTWGFYIIAISALELEERRARIVLGLWATVGVVAAAIGFASPELTARPILSALLPGVYIGLTTGAVALLGVMLLTTRPRYAVAFMIGMVCWRAQQYQHAQMIERHARDVYALQKWANANTPASAQFLLEPPISWRTFAVRRATKVDPQGSEFLVYSRSLASAMRRDSIRAFIRSNSLAEAATWQEMRRRFGGDYVVREITKPALPERVYANRSYAVYRIN